MAASTLESTLQNALSSALSAQNELSAVLPSHEAALSNSLAQGLPPIAISPAQGHSLSILAQLLQAQKILEIGTLGGFSTIFLAKSVPGVRVTAIEYSAKNRDVALENLRNAGCQNVEIHLGAAADVLPKIHADMAEGGQGAKFDFVFVDADWDNQDLYFDWAVKLTRKGGCIYVDNVVRQINEASSDGSTKGRALVEHVKADNRVEAALIPTLATHKSNITECVDGYLIAVVK